MFIKTLFFLLSFSLTCMARGIAAPAKKQPPMSCSLYHIQPMSQKNFEAYRELYLQSLGKAQAMLKPYLEDMLGSIYAMFAFLENSPELKTLLREYVLLKHPKDRAQIKVRLERLLQRQTQQLKSRIKKDFPLSANKTAKLTHAAIVKEGSVIAEKCIRIDQDNDHIKGCVSFDLVSRESRGLKVIINESRPEVSVLDAINHPAALLGGYEQRIDGYSLNDLYQRLRCSADDRASKDPDLVPVLNAADLTALDANLYGLGNQENDNLNVFKAIAEQRKIDPSIFDKVERKSFKFKDRQREIFTMGSPLSEKGRDGSSEKQWTFVLPERYDIQMTPITQLQWFLVMGDNPSRFKKADADGDHAELNGVAMNLNHPVENVSWDEVQAFIAKLDAMDADCRYRLPTEAEWEAAARAQSSSSYFFGDDAGDGNSILSQYAWFNGNAESRTHAVAQKMPNPDGLYDMIGNVWQWTGDWWAKDFRWYSAYKSAFSIDPHGPSSGFERVIRGGGWGDNAKALRSAQRLSASPEDSYNTVGFRLIRTCR